MRRGSVVFLNRFYWPDMAATAQMLTDLAEDLARGGWDVSVITSTAGYAAGGSAPPRSERHNGVRIHRVRGTHFGRHRLLGRAADQGSYLVGAVRQLARSSYDVVVAMTDPPLALPVAAAFGRRRRARLVYWAQDVYPELAARLGVIARRGPVFRSWDAANWWSYRRCEAIVALGPAMAESLARAGAPAERVAVIQNWTDTTAIRPVPREANPLAAELGLGDRFVVLYSGNLGRPHTLGAVVEAMRTLRDDPSVVFLFVGGGARFAELKSIAGRESLPNVRFFDYFPREKLSLSLSLADVGLVTERPDAAGLLVPSKVYGVLASARPLLFVGSAASDVARIVSECECGFTVGPEDAELLVTRIRQLRDSPALRQQMGLRGRAAAEELYDRRIATAIWELLLRRVAEQP